MAGPDAWPASSGGWDEDDRWQRPGAKTGHECQSNSQHVNGQHIMLRKLFGRRDVDTADSATADAAAEIAARETHGDYELRAAPIRDGKVWRVAGSILKVGADESQAQSFVRADTCASHDDAVEISMRKARQIVEEQAFVR